MIRYTLDPGQSKFIVHTGSSGVLAPFGSTHTIAIQDFGGEVRLMPDEPESATFKMVIPSKSLTVIDPIKEEEKNKIETNMREKVLDVENYPEIVFKSTQISGSRTSEGKYQLKIWGDLTLRGITQKTLINALVTEEPSKLLSHGEFTIKQSDFQIKPVAVAGGLVKVKNQIKFTFDILATKASR